MIVRSICSRSSLLFPSFKMSRIKVISSGVKRIPCLLAPLMRAIIIGANSFPDFPEVLEAAVLIKYFYEKIKILGYNMRAVTVYETPANSATYME